MNKLYVKPDINILKHYEKENRFNDREYIRQLGQELSDFFKSYKVKVTVSDCKVTPFAARFDLIPQMGVSVKKIRDLRAELELRFALPVEISVATDKHHTIYVTLKTWDRPLVGFRDILESEEFNNAEYVLPVAAGMDVLGNPFCFDLAQTPNLLVAGTTGAGKSMFLNVIALSLMFKNNPNDLSFIMVDPKRVELGQFNGNPFMLRPVIFGINEAMDAFRWISNEIYRRFDLISSARKKDFISYNEDVSEDKKLKRIVLLIDEYADLVNDGNKELEAIISAIARNGRTTGIHLVLATQQPTKKVVSNGIKASIPCRASFTVVDWRESKAIIDRTGAERLRGSGDMLYSDSVNSAPTHVQASFVSEHELDSLIDDVRIKNYKY